MEYGFLWYSDILGISEERAFHFIAGFLTGKSSTVKSCWYQIQSMTFSGVFFQVLVSWFLWCFGEILGPFFPFSSAIDINGVLHLRKVLLIHVRAPVRPSHCCIMKMSTFNQTPSTKLNIYHCAVLLLRGILRSQPSHVPFWHMLMTCYFPSRNPVPS